MKKIRLKEISEVLNEDELKNVVGGSGTPSRCSNPGCKDSGDCKQGQFCADWSDCPWISEYGRKRCS